MNRQEKILQQAVVPDRLRQFFADVARSIANADPAATTESDDLLQCEFCYGGLAEAETDHFSFVYFPGPERRSKWFLDLSAAQIESIADGRTKSLELWSCKNSTCNSMFADRGQLCFSCDYIDEPTGKAWPAGEFASRGDWAREYFRLNPTAHPMQMIGDFNKRPDLSGSLGSFSLAEAAALKKEAR